jgi:hypothetical protein
VGRITPTPVLGSCELHRLGTFWIDLDTVDPTLFIGQPIVVPLHIGCASRTAPSSGQLRLDRGRLVKSSLPASGRPRGDLLRAASPALAC